MLASAVQECNRFIKNKRCCDEISTRGCVYLAVTTSELKDSRGNVFWIERMLPRPELMEIFSAATAFVCPRDDYGLNPKVSNMRGALLASGDGKFYLGLGDFLGDRANREVLNVFERTFAPSRTRRSTSRRLVAVRISDLTVTVVESGTTVALLGQGLDHRSIKDLAQRHLHREGVPQTGCSLSRQ